MSASVSAETLGHTLVVVNPSGLVCGRCWATYGIPADLVYRHAPTWGLPPRVSPRWVDTFTCTFCRNEVNEPELRLPAARLHELREYGGTFYWEATGEPFGKPVPPG